MDIESRLKEAELEGIQKKNELLATEIELQKTMVEREKVSLETDRLELEQAKKKVDAVPTTELDTDDEPKEPDIERRY
jgi:hypothetical protein